MGPTMTATHIDDDTVLTRKQIGVPARRSCSGADLFVVALALSAVAASALRTAAAADRLPVLTIAADDEEVLIPWKKARPRGPPRFGKRALPSFFGDASTALDAGARQSAQKRAVTRTDLPDGMKFLQRLFRLNGAMGGVASGGARPLPALLLEQYARCA